jgi:hypothetical protein
MSTTVTKRFASAYPILAARLEDGTVVVNNLGDLIGTAGDGVEVNLGSMYSPERAEMYLTDFPSPSDW